MQTNKCQHAFSVEELFDITTPKLRINANTVTVYNYPKGYPYVVRTSQNNGIRGYIEFDEKYLNPANTISFGQDTATMFYQERPYFTGDKIKILILKCDKLNHRTAIYLLASMRKAFSLFKWGQSEFNINTIGKVKIFLPVLSENVNRYDLNDIDWEYMEERIRELGQERIRELELYLKATGLSSCVLTDEDRQIIEKHRNIGKNRGATTVFKLGYLFTSQTGDTDLQQKDVNDKGVFLVSSGETNTGIIGKTNVSAKVISANTLTVDMFGSVYYRDFPYKMVTHARVFALIPKFDISCEIGLFLESVLQKLTTTFSYNNMCSWNKIKDLEILLPVRLNEEHMPVIDPNRTYHSEGYIPDFEYMEKYIRAVQKKLLLTL